jgi:hypothetical protein
MERESPVGQSISTDFTTYTKAETFVPVCNPYRGMPMSSHVNGEKATWHEPDHRSLALRKSASDKLDEWDLRMRMGMGVGMGMGAWAVEAVVAVQQGVQVISMRNERGSGRVIVRYFGPVISSVYCVAHHHIITHG